MNNLSDFVKVYDNACDPKVCQKMIEVFEANRASQILNGKTVRKHLANSQWTELDVSSKLAPADSQYLINSMFQLKDRYNEECQLKPPLPKPGKIDQLIVKRYDPNGEDSFELHFDALGPVSTRYLVVLWYLNDVDEGGETFFPRLNINIKPKAGSVLIFPPYWLYLHGANPPISNAKYIASTYFHW